MEWASIAPDSGKSAVFPSTLPMAPIPVWSGNLRLSLVLVPVRLYPATSSEGTIAFRMIHQPSGKPIKYLKGVETDGHLILDRRQIEALVRKVALVVRGPAAEGFRPEGKQLFGNRDGIGRFDRNRDATD